VYRLDPRGADLWVREHLTMPEISRAIWLLMALAAVGLFLADVAARRISLDFAKMQSSIAGLFGRAPDIGAASMATLAATNAKARAQARARESGRDDASERASAGLGSRERGDEGRNVPSRSATTHSQPAITPPRASASVSASASASANTKPGTDADMMARLRAAKARSQDRTQDISPDGNR
jgi:alkanesulfonate monooxygenase SsuD/methylene tetrahydromethanopterin reductase-like flavin-dependent oxidoreductase (luciferase family)